MHSTELKFSSSYYKEFFSAVVLPLNPTLLPSCRGRRNLLLGFAPPHDASARWRVSCIASYRIASHHAFLACSQPGLLDASYDFPLLVGHFFILGSNTSMSAIDWCLGGMGQDLEQRGQRYTRTKRNWPKDKKDGVEGEQEKAENLSGGKPELENERSVSRFAREREP